MPLVCSPDSIPAPPGPSPMKCARPLRRGCVHTVTTPLTLISCLFLHIECRNDVLKIFKMGPRKSWLPSQPDLYFQTPSELVKAKRECSEGELYESLESSAGHSTAAPRKPWPSADYHVGNHLGKPQSRWLMDCSRINNSALCIWLPSF